MRGVSGLKVFKQLGIGVIRNPGRFRCRIDEPRLGIQIWQACGDARDSGDHFHTPIGRLVRIRSDASKRALGGVVRGTRNGFSPVTNSRRVKRLLDAPQPRIRSARNTQFKSVLNIANNSEDLSHRCVRGLE